MKKKKNTTVNTNALSYRCLQDGNGEQGHNSAFHPESKYRQGRGGERKTAGRKMRGALQEEAEDWVKKKRECKERLRK